MRDVRCMYTTKITIKLQSSGYKSYLAKCCQKFKVYKQLVILTKFKKCDKKVCTSKTNLICLASFYFGKTQEKLELAYRFEMNLLSKNRWKNYE